ncbi:unnamed protein product, partial [marine sediment metagenome]
RIYVRVLTAADYACMFAQRMFMKNLTVLQNGELIHLNPCALNNATGVNYA